MARAIDGNELLDIERLLDTDVVRQSKTASWLIDQVLHDIQAMPTLTPPNEPERAGLYGKYTVYKNKDGSLVTDCFILRPAKDPAAVAALRAYAATTDNAELAADIINWVGAEPNEWVSVEERLPEDEARQYIEDVLDGIGYLYPCLLTYKSPNTERIHVVRFYYDIIQKWFVNNGEELCEKGRCIAWMPLPAPYDRRPPEGEANA